jgi:hypothetical protein
MAFIGQTADPWDVPVRQAVEVMQKIWDVTNGHEYEIVPSSAVYRKVCGAQRIHIYDDANIYVSDCSTSR